MRLWGKESEPLKTSEGHPLLAWGSRLYVELRAIILPSLENNRGFIHGNSQRH